MYIACLCPNLVSVHFYAIPILHFKFPKFLFTCNIAVSLNRRVSALGSSFRLKVHINWRLQQAVMGTKRVRSSNGSHNCAGVTHFTSAFHWLRYLSLAIDTSFFIHLNVSKPISPQTAF